MRLNPFGRATPGSTVESELRSLGRRLCSLHPRLREGSVRLWSHYIRLYPEVVDLAARLRRRTPTRTDPFRVVRVDPDAIENMVEYGAMPRQVRDRQAFPESKFEYAGAVVGGDWDRTERRFEDSELFQSFEAHFERGVPWAETPFFDTVVGHIEDGTELWGCTSRAAFEARCRELDALYAAIDRHGYLSQRELMESSIDDPVRDDDLPYHVRLVNDELAVCIGRDGELLFKDGRDRLAIAKILGLDSIPVWVLIRHERWQELRDALTRDPTLRDHLPSHVRSHPDLDPPSEGSTPVRNQ